MAMPVPCEVQTMRTFVNGLKRCQKQHTSHSPKFKAKCDRVVDMLMNENAKTFKIALDRVPSGMTREVCNATEPLSLILCQSVAVKSGKRKRYV